MNKCTLCDLEGCETLTKKTFHKEEKTEWGDIRIVEYSTYSCCFDNKHKIYCDFCLGSDKVREMIIARPEKLLKPMLRNTNPYDKWIDLKNE